MGARHKPRRRWTPVIALLGLAVGALCLLVAGQATASDYVAESDLPGGQSGATFPMTGCGASALVNLTFPFDARVETVVLYLDDNGTASGQTGTISYDIGDNGTQDGSRTFEDAMSYGGNERGRYDIDAWMVMGQVVQRAGNATADVTVPVRLTACLTGGSWDLQIPRTMIEYIHGAPSLDSPIAAFSMTLGDNLPQWSGDFNLTMHFLNTGRPHPYAPAPYWVHWGVKRDDAGQASASAVTIAPYYRKTPEWDPGSLGPDDTFPYLNITAGGSWTGVLTFRVTVTDAWNRTAESNPIELCVVASSSDACPSTRIIVLSLSESTGSYGVWTIDPEEIQATAGENVRFFLLNHGQNEHNFTVGFYGAQVIFQVGGPNGSPTLQPSESVLSDSFKIPAASVEVWSSVPGDYAKGMRGTLVVDGKPLTVPAFPHPTALLLDGEQKAWTLVGQPIGLSFQTDAPLSATAIVGWWIDGAPAGNSTELEGVNLGVGFHSIGVEISDGNQTSSLYRTIEVRTTPLVPPSQAAPDPLWPAVALAGLALAGAVVASPYARFGLAWLVVGAVLPRTRKPSLLDHFSRGRLYQAVVENPGIHFSELRRRTGIGNGAAIYHLNVLERGGYIRVVVERSKTRFFATDQRLDPASYGLTDADRSVIEEVGRRPGITQSELATTTGRSASVVSKSVRRLRSFGFVSTRRDGRMVSVFPRAAPAGAPNAASEDA